MSAIYFECHITIEPVDDTRRLLEISTPQLFKLAELRMTKISTNGVSSSPSMILTGHAKQREPLVDRMRSMVQTLRQHGYSVLRYKIEDISMDSRSSDSEGLL